MRVLLLSLVALLAGGASVEVELVENGGFESELNTGIPARRIEDVFHRAWPGRWMLMMQGRHKDDVKLALDEEIHKSGNRSVRIDFDTDDFLEPPVAMVHLLQPLEGWTPGKAYRLSGWVRCQGDAGVRLSVEARKSEYGDWRIAMGWRDELGGGRRSTAAPGQIIDCESESWTRVERSFSIRNGVEIDALVLEAQAVFKSGGAEVTLGSDVFLVSERADPVPPPKTRSTGSVWFDEISLKEVQ
jgi:hypothetical protein